MRRTTNQALLTWRTVSFAKARDWSCVPLCMTIVALIAVSGKMIFRKATPQAEAAITDKTNLH
ncbi:MAG: hypothetical protein HOP21_02450 [Methylotenera sp.]|nr:hypothetical protein [Methylotenera sp.]